MKVEFRYRHHDGTWSSWSAVACISTVAECLKTNPVGAILAIKHPLDGNHYSVRQWRRVS